MDNDKIEFLKNNIIEIIDELKALGCDLDPDVLYYPESGCIIV